MTIIELLLIAVALAMDAFTVSICKGLSIKDNKLPASIICGIWFGGFQFLMPVIGWFLGSTFTKYLTKYAHWISFILLLLIGANMVREALKEDDESESGSSLKVGEMLGLAVATSIDALAVGVTFALLDVSVLLSSLFIGVITFAICFFGVFIGSVIGEKYSTKAKIAGGIVLMLIGIRILINGLRA